MAEDPEDDLEFWQEETKVAQGNGGVAVPNSPASSGSLYRQSPSSQVARSIDNNQSSSTHIANQTALTYQQSLNEAQDDSASQPSAQHEFMPEPPSESSSSLTFQQSMHTVIPHPGQNTIAFRDNLSISEFPAPRQDSRSELSFRQDSRTENLFPRLARRQMLPPRKMSLDSTNDLTFRQNIPRQGNSTILRDLSPIPEREPSPPHPGQEPIDYPDMGSIEFYDGGQIDPNEGDLGELASSPHARRSPTKRPVRNPRDSSPQGSKRNKVRRQNSVELFSTDNDDDGSNGRVKTIPRIKDHFEPPVPVVKTVPVEDLEPADYEMDGPTVNVNIPDADSMSEDDWSENDSVKEMIVPDTDSSDGEGSAHPTSSSESDSDQSAELSSDDEEYAPDDTTLAELANRAPTRRQQPMRTRVPTLEWWKGEQIIYDYDSKGIATATDVLEVEVPEPQKRPYHRRGRYTTRSSVPHPRQYEITEIPPQNEWRAPIYTGPGNTLHEEILAKPLTDFEFEPYPGNDLVEVAGLFDPPPGIPVELLIMRIKGGGKVNYALLRERAFTFIVWAGRLRINVNSEAYVLNRGMACRVPRGNELTLHNLHADLAVELIITEIGRDEPEQVSVSVSSILP